MSQGWVNSPMMFWRDNKAGSESTHFGLDSWGLLLISQCKYFAFSTEQPQLVVHIIHNRCLFVLSCVTAAKSARAEEGINSDTPGRLRAGQREHPPVICTHTHVHTHAHTPIQRARVFILCNCFVMHFFNLMEVLFRKLELKITCSS